MKYFILIIFLSALFFNACSDDVTDPINLPPSDITRAGKFISFTSSKDGNFDIYLAEVDAGGNLLTTGFIYPSNPFNLTADNSGTDMQSNWSPDGRILVYSSEENNIRRVMSYFFSTDGKPDTTVLENPRPVFTTNQFWDENPFFSPDGLYLVWDRRYDNANPSGIDTADSRDLYIADVTGFGDSMLVNNPRAIKETSGEDEFNAKWSPRINVRRLAYEFRSSTTATDNDVYIIDPLNPSDNFVFHNPGKSGYPAWAPNCQSIIFESDQGNGGYYKISLKYYPSGTDLIDVARVTGLNLRYPTHQPNGSYLGYTRFETDNSGILYVVRIEPPYSNLGVRLLPAAFDNAVSLYPSW